MRSELIKKSSPASTIRKAVLLAGACTLVLVLILRYQGYQNIVRQSERLTLASLENNAWSISKLINGDEHQQLQEIFTEVDAISSLEQNKLYDNLHRTLALAQKELGVETPIYTYTKALRSSTFDFIATSSVKPYFRHPFTTAPKEQVESYGESKSLPVYSDKHGVWLSACSPIYNSTGEVVAMVQVDQCFEHFIAEAKQDAFAGLWWNFLLILFLVAMVWKYVTVLIYREEEDKLALQKIIGEKTELSERLTLREKELERQKKSLVNKNQYLEDFANIVSHDLKSPLRGISNFASLLSRRLGSTAESSTTEYVNFIKSNAKRALRLVDGILNYSKLGTDAQNNTPCNLLDLVENARENLYSVIETRSAVVEVVERLPNAVCDKVIVTQLFQNLISNGLKYNTAEVPMVKVTCTKDAEKGCVMAVSDNGIGIAKEYQSSIFEMFTRLHGSEGQFEGSGIGLAFCLRIIKSYGGEIWLESEEGKGSTFYFNLPGALVGENQMA